ncbi:MAG: class A beta-lactamase-related serine hydrolase [Sphingobacteriia bacterium]|nr:MAG: class A beta-lactamase-related serine hydrolase [Sphingobacteriia bacterium]
MKINITYYLLLLFCCFTYNSDAQKKGLNDFNFETTSKPADVGFSANRLTYIDSLLSKYIQTGMMPNAVTFIARKGKVVHYKAYGYKSIERKELLKKDDIFRIASQTKALTSVALMMLYEKGMFLLDDPIEQYIPEFKHTKVLLSLNTSDTSYTTRPAKTPITIRHLLNHTSGIPYGNAIYEKNKIPGVNSLEPITIGAVVKKLAGLPIEHDPGEKFTYGFNTDVLGYLIEVLSGMPLDQYFQKYIFEPLEMNDSYFYLPAHKVSRLVTLYSKDSLNSPFYISTSIANQTYPYAGAQKYFSGGAGVVGPIGDYAKFCMMLLNGGSYNGKQLLGRKTIDLMTTNQIGDLEVWDTKDKFGLGFQVFSEKGLKSVPGSVGAFKWGGMYNTDYIIDPKEELIMLVYTNVHPYANPSINQRFRVLVYQALQSHK